MWIGIQVNNEHSGAVPVACPFKVSGFLLDDSGQPKINSEIIAQIGVKSEKGFTDESGRFELTFTTIEPGGPYAIILNQETIPKISVMVEEEFVWGNNNDPFVEAIERKSNLFKNAHQTQMVAANQIIVFFGTKGGLGTSSIAAVVAKELYAQGVPVMVIEAARSGGSLLRMFSTPPSKYGLDAIVDAVPDEIGEAIMSPYLIEIRKGLEILPISTAGNLQGQSSWTIRAAKELYRWASRRSGYVVVDAGSDITFPLANAAVWMANKIFPIAGGNLVEIDSAARFAMMAQQCQWTRIMPGWVARKNQGDLESLTGVRPAFFIPDSQDWEQVAQGKISGTVKKSVTKIIEAAQVVLGGNFS